MATDSLIRGSAIALALMFACSASAATRTAAFQITANVEASCRVRAPASFDAMPDPARLSDRVQVDCTPAAAHSVSMAAPLASVRVDEPLKVRRLLVLVMY